LLSLRRVEKKEVEKRHATIVSNNKGSGGEERGESKGKEIPEQRSQVSIFRNRDRHYLRRSDTRRAAGALVSQLGEEPVLRSVWGKTIGSERSGTDCNLELE